MFLTLALIGLILPARRYAAWISTNGLDGHALLEDITSSLISRGLADTVFVLTAATLIFIVTECLARRDRLSTICIPITCVLGVGVGLPFYLYLRLRRRD